MDILNRINHTRFLGREFLSWLWYRSDAQEGIFELGDGPIEVWFDQKLTLESLGDVNEQSVVKSDTPTDTDEARVALQSGKLVAEARLRIISGQKQWTVSVKGDTLGLGSVKIPALLSREDDDQLYERFYLLEELEDVVDVLFAEFVNLRLDDARWAEEIEAIRTWVHREE